MPGVIVKLDPPGNNTSPQAAVIPIATCKNDGAMSKEQACKLDGIPEGGGVTEITAGSGIVLTPDPITSTGEVAVGPSGVAPGTYTNATVTVGADGRVTAAASGGSPSAAGAILFWGNGDLSSTPSTRYSTPGYQANGIASTTRIDSVMPRAGTLRNLFVHHNTVNGNGNSVTYTIMLNGVATAITATLATGAIGTASDTVHTIAVVQGDRIALEVTKGAVIADGKMDMTATIEVA